MEHKAAAAAESHVHVRGGDLNVSATSAMSAPFLKLSPGPTPTYRGFVADRALDHVLMQLPIQVDEGLAHAAVDDRHAASVGADDGCVGRR